MNCHGDHNHDNGLIESSVRSIVQKELAHAASSSGVSQRSVYQNIATKVLESQVGDIGLPFIPSSKSLAMSLQRKKRKESDHPSIPHDWDDS